MKGLKKKDKRFCYGCGSDKSWVDKNGYEHWLANKPTDLWICHTCRARYIQGPLMSAIFNSRRTKEMIQRANKKRLNFKQKTVWLPENPRTGVCSLCHKTGRTNMHHIQYHEDNPLKDTIELCNACHKNAHRGQKYKPRNRGNRKIGN